MLTDCHYVVLNVLRTHSKDIDALVRVGRVYPTFETTVVVPNRESSSTSKSMVAQSLFPKPASAHEMLTWLQNQVKAPKISEDTSDSVIAKQEKQRKKMQLRQVLSNKGAPWDSIGPSLTEHCVLKAGLQPTMKIFGNSLIFSTEFEEVKSGKMAKEGVDVGAFRAKLEKLLEVIVVI